MKTFEELVLEGLKSPKDFMDWLGDLEIEEDLYERIGFPEAIYNQFMDINIKSPGQGYLVLEKYFDSKKKEKNR